MITECRAVRHTRSTASVVSAGVKLYPQQTPRKRAESLWDPARVAGMYEEVYLHVIDNVDLA